MPDKANRVSISLSAYLTLILSLSLLTASSAWAFDGPRSDKSDSTSVTTSAREVDTASAEARKRSYVLYEDAVRRGVDSESAATGSEPAGAVTRPRRVSAVTRTSPAPLPPGGPAVSTAPMTPGEKFTLFYKKSFLSPGAYALSVLSGVYGEWTDTKNNHHHSNPGDFAADSMTRAARSFAFRANANFFEKFMFASMFRQDPRYHRSDRKGAGAKIGYAVSRLFVTQGDRNGKDQFNVSFIAGGLAASGMANLWERDERRDLHHFATRWGVHMGLTAFTNIVREFVGGQ